MELERYFSGTPWESKVGYCRAIKAGKNIFYHGCTMRISRLLAETSCRKDG